VPISVKALYREGQKISAAEAPSCGKLKSDALRIVMRGADKEDKAVA